MILPQLWAVFTVCAAASQTARNAMQRELTTTVGTIGATHLRFFFGLPFALLFFAGLWLVTGDTLPHPPPSFWPWLMLAACSQIVATGLMLAAMAERSFVVATAYLKTEPVQVAILGFLLLGERLSPLMIAGIAVAMAGVMVMVRVPRGTGSQNPLRGRGARAAILGLLSGSVFGLSSVGYRGALQGLPHDHYVLVACFAMTIALTLQTVVFTAWLVWYNAATFRAILRAWRPSIVAGFFGALASQFWISALIFGTAASVRTLALVEVVFAQGVSRFVFKQQVTRAETLGVVLIVAGCLLLVWPR